MKNCKPRRKEDDRTERYLQMQTRNMRLRLTADSLEHSLEQGKEQCFPIEFQGKEKAGKHCPYWLSGLVGVTGFEL